MYQQKAQILSNSLMGPSYYRISLKCDKGFKDAVPGQFVTLGFTELTGRVLRRPFSIHRIITEGGTVTGIDILYKVVGDCTASLAGLQQGGELDILGPIGNSFPVSDGFQKGFMIAGGIGTAPLVFLAMYLKDKGADLTGFSLFSGGKSKEDLLCIDEFASLNMNIHTVTEDGSAGEKGLVTDHLDAAIRKKKPDVIYACGPMGMLKAVARIAEARNTPCHVSIETVMACGMGACLGCAVETRQDQDTYPHVCIDGPVFNSKDLKL